METTYLFFPLFLLTVFILYAPSPWKSVVFKSSIELNRLPRDAIAQEGKGLIADEATAFSQACLRPLNDEALWNQLSKSSREIAREKYQWQAMFERMDVELKKILD